MLFDPSHIPFKFWDSVFFITLSLVSHRMNTQTRCANKILTMDADDAENKRNENETLTAEMLL